MNAQGKYFSELQQAELAGKSEFERSEKSLLPAGPTGERGPEAGEGSGGADNEDVGAGEVQGPGPSVVPGSEPNICEELDRGEWSADERYDDRPAGGADAEEDREEAEPRATLNDVAQEPAAGLGGRFSGAARAAAGG